MDLYLYQYTRQVTKIQYSITTDHRNRLRVKHKPHYLSI